MNVWLFCGAIAVLLPDGLAAVDPCVYEKCRDGRKGKSIGNGKGGADKERRVCFVCRLVEGELRRKDLGRVVRLASVVVGASVAHGQVGRVPGAAVVQY